MGYHETLRKLKFGAVIYILFIVAYILVKHFIIDLPMWGIAAGGAAILSLMLSPFVSLPSRKSKEKAD